MSPSPQDLKLPTRKQAGRKPIPIILDAPSAHLLEIAQHSPQLGKRKRKRAEAILRIAQGGRYVVITKELGLTRNTLRRCTRLFNAGGVEGLLGKKATEIVRQAA